MNSDNARTSTQLDRLVGRHFMNCDCVEKIDKQLKRFNTKLAICHSIDFGTGSCDSLIVVKTESIKGGKRKQVVVTYCPFCGIDATTKKKVVKRNRAVSKR